MGADVTRTSKSHSSLSHAGDADHDDAVRLERSALGCVLEYPALIGEVEADVTDCFLIRDHRLLWRAMVKLHGEGIAPDITLLPAESGVDAAYIGGLLEPGYFLSNFRNYTARIRKSARDRCFRQLHEELGMACADDRPRIIQQMNELLIDSSSEKKGIQTFADVPEVLSLLADPDHQICRDLLVRRGVTMIASEPGVGKSFLEMALLVNVAIGGEFLGRPCKRTRVLMLDRENRTALLQKRLGLIAGGPLPNLKIWCSGNSDPPPKLGDPRLLAIAREEPTVFGFDSLVRFHDQNENLATASGKGDGDTGMAYVTGQARLLADVGSTVLILHHKGKGEKDYRGSEEIIANVDVAYVLLRDGENGRKLHNTKFRDGPDGFDIRISCDFEGGNFRCTDTVVVSEQRDPTATLQHLIEQEPGIGVNKIVKASGIRKSDVIQLLKGGKGELWHSKIGPRRAHFYFPGGTDPGLVPATGSREGRELVPDAFGTGSHIDSNGAEPVETFPPVPKTPPLYGEVLDWES